MNTPTSVESLLQGAAQYFQAADFTTAERLCREALRIAPGHTDATVLLASVLLADNRSGEAQTMFEALVQQHPGEAAFWINLGTARRGQRKFDDALAAYAQAAALGERSADFYYNVGLTHLDRSDFESARATLARAAELSPRDAETRFRQAQSCYECLQTQEAVDALADWRNFEDGSPELLAQVAQLLMNLGEQQQAREAVARAMAMPDLTAEATVTLIQVLERSNQLTAANDLLERLQRDPRASTLGEPLALARAALAQRSGDAETARKLLTQTVAGVRDAHERHHQLYPLAKALDTLGRHDEAMEVLREAHASQVQHLMLAFPALTVRGAPTLAVTNLHASAADRSAWQDPDAPTAAASPIFVVAFPRSGTTLLELTLDAHPQLRSMDEQPFVQNALEDMVGFGAEYPQQLASLDATQLATVRSRYWERVARRVKLRPGERLIDKNPLNILRLAAMQRLFPNAPIIVAIRHPLDVIMSCYMQHFRAPDFAMLCRDLPTLATGFQRTFDYWYEEAATLQPKSYEVRYETLVSDFEPQVRAMAEFLELPWHDQMLQPGSQAQSRGFISTPSYSQVIDPVHTRSIGRWKRHASALQPLTGVLAPLLQRWHYDFDGSVNSK